ncbi:uncharacterized protein LOC141911277 isoform X1 [Tubulanus polymorphus]|uniref:uncharacterized protein LOC141911277 isoform X1 n=1 Tax=Tubulanus polymorphus TaxID=672921 RepID=UPI003DA60551
MSHRQTMAPSCPSDDSMKLRMKELQSEVARVKAENISLKSKICGLENLGDILLTAKAELATTKRELETIKSSSGQDLEGMLQDVTNNSDDLLSPRQQEAIDAMFCTIEDIDACVLEPSKSDIYNFVSVASPGNTKTTDVTEQKPDKTDNSPTKSTNSTVAPPGNVYGKTPSSVGRRPISKHDLAGNAVSDSGVAKHAFSEGEDWEEIPEDTTVHAKTNPSHTPLAESIHYQPPQCHVSPTLVRVAPTAPVTPAPEGETPVSAQVQDLSMSLANALGQTQNPFSPSLSNLHKAVLILESRAYKNTQENVKLHDENMSLRALVNSMKNDMDVLKARLGVSERKLAEQGNNRRSSATSENSVNSESTSTERKPVQKEQTTPAASQSATSTRARDQPSEPVVMKATLLGNDGDELKRKFDEEKEKMKRNMAELKKANRLWEKYCSDMKSEHERDIYKLKEELAGAREKEIELTEQAETRTAEIDRWMVNLKRKLDTEQRDKEEALQQLHVEQQRCASLETRQLESENEKVALREQANELERKIQQIRDEQEEFLGQIQFQPASIHQPNVAPPREQQEQPVQLPENLQSIKDENEVLKMQVTIYKEDFDKERRDRERLARDKEEIQERLNELVATFEDRSLQLHDTDEIRELRRKVRELEGDAKTLRIRVRNLETEKTRVEQKCRQKTTELMKLDEKLRQTQIRISEAIRERDYYKNIWTDRAEDAYITMRAPINPFAFDSSEREPRIYEEIPNSWRTAPGTAANNSRSAVAASFAATSRAAPPRVPPNIRSSADKTRPSVANGFGPY